MPQLKKVMAELEKLAPIWLAENWDHVGMMVGNPEAEIHKVLCALDLNEQVIDEAISSHVDCIVTHHPFFFKPISSIDLSSEKGRMINKLITHQVAVYAMHTNYDIAWGGLNDYLAEGLGLQDIQVLSVTKEEAFCKVVVYVPETHVQQVREMIVNETKTHIGDYKGCTFAADGEGTFMPLEGSHPFIGEVNQLSVVKEKAVAFMVLESEATAVLKAIRKVHPYEEMAYDIIKLEKQKKVYGLGRYGRLKQPMPLGQLLENIKAFFNLSHLRVSTQSDNQMIETIALCSGEGSEFIGEAAEKAQLYITGDVKFHQAQLAQSLELVLVDVGHYASENRALEPIGQCIEAAFPECELIYSKVNGETLFIR